MSANAAGFDFSQFVPGFDFLRQMTQPSAAATGTAAPQWIAPTMDPEEVERRVQELRTVLFWLEQNTTALKATIQALEVQKMTLTTLRGMNVPMPDTVPADAAASMQQAVEQAGQWWGSMMNTFGQIAQQAQADVVQRQAEFAQTTATAPAPEVKTKRTAKPRTTTARTTRKTSANTAAKKK